MPLFLSKILIKNASHIIKHTTNIPYPFFQQSLYNFTKKLNIISLQKTISQLKTILPLITFIIKKKGTILIIKNNNINLITNNKIPDLIIILEKNKIFQNLKFTYNTPIISIFNLGIIPIKTTYPIFVNSTKQTKFLQIKLIKNAINTGLLQELFTFSDKNFPRLDLNQ